MLEIENVNTVSHCAECLLWERLRICRKTDSKRMNYRHSALHSEGWSASKWSSACPKDLCHHHSGSYRLEFFFLHGNWDSSMSLIMIDYRLYSSRWISMGWTTVLRKNEVQIALLPLSTFSVGRLGSVDAQRRCFVWTREQTFSW